MRKTGALGAITLALLTACGSPPPAAPDASADAPSTEPCATDADCDDGLFCTGAEVCDPADPAAAADGCVPASSPCAATETCDGQDNNCNYLIDDGVGGGQAYTNTNANGTCPGTRACDGPSGFVRLGKTQMAESCNYADDNCNGTADEGFTGLGTPCTAGIRGCTRYGSQRCNSAGNGLTCSAVAGTPTTELCNQIDDDCNNMVDEPFKTGAMAIGAQCSSGLGVCARYGSYVCKTDGSGTQCSATAGTNSSRPPSTAVLP